jgi:signal-transduction protein with cAMP-binding, CBS, and nucleotidyltransferase domain
MSIYQDLITDRVSNLEINKNPIIVSSSTPIREAVQKLKDNKKGCVLICEEKVLKGIFTERDLLNRVFGEDKKLDIPLEELMTSDPVTVQLNDIVSDAVKKMRNGGYRHLPVITEEGCPVGVLSVKHIVHFLVDHFPEEVYNLPPDPDESPPTPEGA